MQFSSTKESWGVITIIIHWLTVFIVIGLFILGLWMVELTYYDDWYKTAPFIHKSIGILLLFLTLSRIIWRLTNITPAVLPTHNKWEKKLAGIMHITLYIALLCVMISGYLISTADGRNISVFGWFEVPAIVAGIEHQEDIAGWVHFYTAIILISLASLHGMAAIKHHFIDKDATLKRMLWLQ